jgi:hypothetical protein
MNIDAKNPDLAETSYTVGRIWSLGGKAIILSNDFFDRKPPARSPHAVAFASQVETLFHEVYHHGIGYYYDFPQDTQQIVATYAENMRKAIENTEEYKHFFTESYLPYVQ